MTDRSAEELERDAERIRSGIADTTDELKSRMSPGQMVDEVANYLRDSDGSIAIDRFRHQVRENPMALALIGTGVAWLMWGGGGRSASRDDDDYDYDDVPRVPASYRSGPGYDPAPGSAYGASDPVGSGVIGTGSSTGSTYTGTTPSGASGVRSYSSAAGSTGGMDEPDDSGPSLRERAGDLAEKAGDFVHGAADRMRGASHDARDRARDFGEGAMARGRSVAGRSRRYAASGSRSFFDALEREPLVTGAIGLAVGAAIGAMLPRTRYEDEAFGDTRDRLARGAGDAFDRAKDKAGHVAEEAYAAARSAAEDEGLVPSGDKPLAERVGNVAKAAATGAGREASHEADRAGYGTSPTGTGATGTRTTGTGSGLSSGTGTGVGSGATPGSASGMGDQPRSGTDDLTSRGSEPKRDTGPGGTGPA